MSNHMTLSPARQIVKIANTDIEDALGLEGAMLLLAKRLPKLQLGLELVKDSIDELLADEVGQSTTAAGVVDSLLEMFKVSIDDCEEDDIDWHIDAITQLTELNLRMTVR